MNKSLLYRHRARQSFIRYDTDVEEYIISSSFVIVLFLHPLLNALN